jgi:hypothetical protein
VGCRRALCCRTRELYAARAVAWADFHDARGRALAGFGGGSRDDAAIAELRRLRDAAERDGVQLMLPALRAALADAAAMAPVPVGSVQ